MSTALEGLSARSRASLQHNTQATEIKKKQEEGAKRGHRATDWSAVSKSLAAK